VRVDAKDLLVVPVGELTPGGLAAENGAVWLTVQSF
jgi:hypothetical protein